MARIMRRRMDSQPERQIITGMIVSDEFLRQLRPLYRAELMQIPFAKTAARWCLSYFEKYQKAPRKHIQDIYESHARKGLAEEQSDLIGDFLQSISEEHQRSDKFNVQYALDQAEAHFKSRSLEILKEDIESELADGNLLEAEAALSRYKRVARTSSDGVNPFLDKDGIIEAFEEDDKPLFTLPGAAGEFFNAQAKRGNFIAFEGPEKRGKTYMLIEMAKRAYKARNNVAYFGLGDMNKAQMIRRIAVGVAGRPYQLGHCGRLIIPCLDCERNQEDTCHKEFRKCRVGLEGAETLKDAPRGYHPCTACEGKRNRRFKGAVWYSERDPVEPLTWREAIRLGRRFAARSAGKKEFKMVCRPARTMSMADVDAQLDIWEEMEGFIADVVVLDYHDLLAPEPGGSKDDRHKINDNWIAARALNLKRNNLLLTATQTDTDSYTRETIGAENFSEDKRKHAHITGLMGLNQTDEEKAAGLMRWNWVFLRESDFDRRRTVKVLQCLQLGRPLLASYW